MAVRDFLVSTGNQLKAASGPVGPAALEDQSSWVCPRPWPAFGVVPDGSGDISEGLTGPPAVLNPRLWDFPRRALSSPRRRAPQAVPPATSGR